MSAFFGAVKRECHKINFCLMRDTEGNNQKKDYVSLSKGILVTCQGILTEIERFVKRHVF